MGQHNSDVRNVVTGTVRGTVIQVSGDLNTSGIVFGNLDRVVEVPDADTITILNGHVFIDGQDLTT